MNREIVGQLEMPQNITFFHMMIERDRT